MSNSSSRLIESSSSLIVCFVFACLMIEMFDVANLCYKIYILRFDTWYAKLNSLIKYVCMHLFVLVF